MHSVVEKALKDILYLDYARKIAAGSPAYLGMEDFSRDENCECLGDPPKEELD